LDKSWIMLKITSKNGVQGSRSGPVGKIRMRWLRGIKEELHKASYYQHNESPASFNIRDEARNSYDLPEMKTFLALFPAMTDDLMLTVEDRIFRSGSGCAAAVDFSDSVDLSQRHFSYEFAS